MALGDLHSPGAFVFRYCMLGNQTEYEAAFALPVG